jgi:signal peptidase I
LKGFFEMSSDNSDQFSEPTANSAKAVKTKNMKSEIGGIAVAILIALTIRWVAIESYVIPSGSMLPTLLIHDHIFINKLIYGIRLPFSKIKLIEFSEPKRGDVIVFRYPEDESVFFIKRIIGVHGDLLMLNDTGLFINGKKIETEAASNHDYDWVRDVDMGENKEDYQHLNEHLEGVDHSVLVKKDISHRSIDNVTIAPNTYFALGDNRDNSRDSRYWGPVPKENILGRALFVWLSCDDMLPVANFICNPLELRWGRFFHPIK